MDSPAKGDERARGMRFLLELGRGGMGVVYLALAQGPARFQKLKVVKRLRADLAAEPRALEMFLDEARLAARLHHPNIVQTNEVGFDGKHYFLEMEYLEGQSFDALAREARRRGVEVPLETSAWILAQVLGGLHHAHELRDLDGRKLEIVHRDVSPHNVMVTYDGEVKLLDFGIAKAADSQAETQTGVVKGKITYMAPEQATRRPVDRRADVFAVGVMLWQAIVGERLWGDANDFEIFMKLQLGLPIPSPREKKPDAPAALDAIARRALAVEPADRYATAQQMKEDLEAWFAGRSSGSAQAVVSLMNELFAAQRGLVRAEIEAQIKGTPAGASAVDVPVLGERVREGGTGNAEVGRTGATKLRQRTEIRGLRAITLGAIGVALVASVAAVFGVRGRRATGPSPSASGAGAAPGAGCTTNAACTAKNGGRASVCNHATGACATLEAEGCTLLADPGDVESERTLWIGAMFQLSGPQADAIGRPSMRAVDLGRRDFAQIAHGVPQLTGSEPPRPLGVVMCNDASDAAARARHLVAEVGVPAVIGFNTSQEVIDLATSLFIPQRVMAVPSMNVSALITAVPHPPGERRLIFRTSLSSAQLTAPMSAFVGDVLEPAVHRAVGARETIRLAFVRPKTTSGLAFADALYGRLRYNGKSVVENGAAFREVSTPDPTTDPTPEQYTPAVDAVLAFRPHIVVYVGEDELTRPFLEPIERRWPRAESPPPYYLTPNSLGGAEFYKWVGTNAGLRRRFFDVAAAASTPANVKFTMRYNETFGEHVTPNSSPAGPYDALYLVAYAAALAGPGANGSELARAVARLVPPGAPIEVGPSHIFEAVEALRTGGNVDLQGAGSRLDFDLTNGESPADCVIECLAADARGAAAAVVESGVAFDASAQKLVGALACR